jgi:hypothetical protein
VGSDIYGFMHSNENDNGRLPQGSTIFDNKLMSVLSLSVYPTRKKPKKETENMIKENRNMDR